MGGLYSITTRSDGTVLTASIYNSDHQNHVDNLTPQMTDDYSTSAVQMQTTTDPGEVGTESLPTSLAGELERLRFAIGECKTAIGLTAAKWHSTPTGVIGSAFGAHPALIDEWESRGKPTSRQTGRSLASFRSGP